MRNKETGEFELVVGDKQLLSGFFIGVLLLAVVFAMGYVLGRGTPRSAAVAPESAATSSNGATQPATTAPAPVSPVTPESSAPVMTDVGHADDTPPATGAAEPPPQPTTMPAKEAGAPAQSAAKAAAPVSALPADDATAGTYWQVHAGSHSSAEAVSQTLKGRGFPVVTRPGRDNLTLVWVGPYTDKESLTKAKKQLEDAGMTNLFKKP